MLRVLPMLTRTSCCTASTESSLLTQASSTRPTCHCLGVTAEEIREEIAAQDLTSVRQVTKACGAGGGCTACHRHIKRFLAEAAAERAATESLVPAFGFA
ncbi:hypothetical protein GC163_19565 [bacterium]|nr:hypothetical protein [bacterium]